MSKRQPGEERRKDIPARKSIKRFSKLGVKGTDGEKSQTTFTVILKFRKQYHPCPGKDKCRCLFGWYSHSDILSKSFSVLKGLEEIG